MHRWLGVAFLFLLAGCSSSEAGEGGKVVEGCVEDEACPAAAPWCVEGACVACAVPAHCPAERPMCLEGTCWGGACLEDAECEAAAPVCDRGICTGCADDASCGEGFACMQDGTCARRPDALVLVIDRSETMYRCTPGGGEGWCDGNGNGTLDTHATPRWDVLRGVLADPTWAPASMHLGLVAAGALGADPTCGLPSVLVPPRANAHATYRMQWDNPLLEAPWGSRPVAAALEATAELLAGAALEGDVRVVLVTDGLPSCNGGHDVPCICAEARGCPTETGGRLAYGLEGRVADPSQCADVAGGLEAVERIRATGARLAILSLASWETGPLAPLAAAGGLASPTEQTGIHVADSADAFRAAFDWVLTAD